MLAIFSTTCLGYLPSTSHKLRKTSTNVYNRCDWMLWQLECFDSLTAVKLDCLDSLTALTAWLPSQLDCLDSLLPWLSWQLDCLDSLTALTAWLPWQLESLTALRPWELYCLESLTALRAIKCEELLMTLYQGKVLDTISSANEQNIYFTSQRNIC